MMILVPVSLTMRVNSLRIAGKDLNREYSVMARRLLCVSFCCKSLSADLLRLLFFCPQNISLRINQKLRKYTVIV